MYIIKIDKAFKLVRLFALNMPATTRIYDFSITIFNNATHGPRLVVTFEGSDNIAAAFDLGNDGSLEWNHSGNLRSGTISPDLAAVINSYLANATPSFTDAWGNEFVDIPLNITGNATLVMSDLNVSYDWNPTVAITPTGDLANEINQH